MPKGLKSYLEKACNIPKFKQVNLVNNNWNKKLKARTRVSSTNQSLRQACADLRMTQKMLEKDFEN